MARELAMPALSPTMEKGVLARWLVKPGDLVKAGDLLAEIESDKATMELAADDDGLIQEILVADGADGVAVGTIIALLADTRAIAADDVPPRGEAVDRKTPAPEQLAPVDRPVREQATPLARRIAKIRDIDLREVTGSGHDGKVLAADLGISAIGEATIATRPGVSAWSSPTGAALQASPVMPNAGSADTCMPNPGIAGASAREIPHFQITLRCNLDPLQALCEKINADLEGIVPRLSVRDFLIKALALALVEVPAANVRFDGYRPCQANGVAVAMVVATGGGFAHPVLRDPDLLSLSAIASRSKVLVGMARQGQPDPEDCAPATTSLFSLDRFECDEVVPSIGPPYTLAIGTAPGMLQPWNVGGAIGLAKVMTVTAKFDSRAIDEIISTSFMNALKIFIENPIILAA